ncbi:hypothetical protein [Tenacibaculum sp. 190524A05c]|uniref:hypothetical protein n=1 Tax=Tenacibaculum platacis TaxID=3137852 RepID=UPI0031FA761C
MTVIAFRRKKNNFEIASDSQISFGQRKMPMYNNTTNDSSLECYGKMFQVNGTTIGCAGILSQITLLQVFCKEQLPESNEAHSIILWLVDFMKYLSDKTLFKSENMNFKGLMIKEDRCFFFSNNLDVAEVKEFDAIGSGKDYAIGAMQMGADVEKAVEVANIHDIHCGGKISKIVIEHT